MTRRTSQLLSTAAALGLWASAAAAGGVAPGETLQNSFSMSYESGGDRINIDNADSADVLVHQRIAFTLVPTFTGGVVEVEPGNSNEILTFALTNTGNAATEFDIDSFVTTLGDASIQLQYGTNDQPGTWRMITANPGDMENTAAGYAPDGIQSITLAPDQTITVAVVANIPDTEDGKREDFLLVARAVANGAIMSQGATGNGYDAYFADTARDNYEENGGAYLVSAPILTASKTIGLVESAPGQGFDCALDGSAAPDGAFIPGACIEYEITVSNHLDASKSAHNLTISDNLPAGVTFRGVSGQGFSDIDASAAPLIEGHVLELAPGDSATMNIRATVD